MTEDHERYLAVRRDYIDRERAASEKTEQVLLTGAAGALALSLTFIEKIAPTPHSWTMWILGVAWVSLLVSLGGTLTGYELRSRAYAAVRCLLDEAQNPDALDTAQIEKHNRRLILVAQINLGSLMLGVILLVVFAFLNINQS